MAEAEGPAQETIAAPAAQPLVAALGDNSGFLLSTAGRLIRERFQEALRESGMQARHFGVLAILANTGPLPQGEAARLQGLDKSTLVGIVDDLEQWGLVERRRSRTDRRAYALTLTDAGRARLTAATAIAAASGDWLAPLDAAEQAQLGVLLRRLLYGEGGWLTQASSSQGKGAGDDANPPS